MNVTNTYKQGGANCKSLEPKGRHKGKAWCYVKKGSCSDAVQGRYGTYSYMVCEPYWNRRDMGYKSDGTSGGSTANTPASAANAPTKATRSVARPRPGTTAGMKVRCTCSNVKNAHGQGDASCKAKEKGKPWCYVKKNSCSDGVNGIFWDRIMWNRKYDRSFEACKPYYNRKDLGYSANDRSKPQLGNPARRSSR